MTKFTVLSGSEGGYVPADVYTVDSEEEAQQACQDAVASHVEGGYTCEPVQKYDVTDLGNGFYVIEKNAPGYRLGWLYTY